MAGGFPPSRPEGDAAIARIVQALRRDVDALKASAGILSAVIGSGGVTVKDGGGMSIEAGGFLRAYHSNGEGAIYFGALLPEDTYESGLLLADLLGAARFWVAQRDDGVFEVVSRADRTRLVGGEVFVGDSDTTTLTRLRGQEIRISTGHLSVYDLPTTSAAANLHLGTVGGQWTVAYITSSRRYKQDIEDLDVDPLAVLKWQPRTWRDKTDVAAVGGEAKRHIGFIAEEVDEAGTPEFVIHDDEGLADGLAYDRMTIGLHAVDKYQQKQIEDLRAELEAVRAENARKDRIIAALCDATGIDPEEVA
ncbi:tail fiber domain-containing protein [Aeromicrobium phragmitis]|uniref:Tail fiber domain-containing protein n=1 Tax=Aeromicrobium phragmitis TaxID=2478914 RepID=A0A3L8PIA9_9ACTN|nr:tail fiber domain-containing protein [Aeromicrobium phragmitis]RLV54840.1 tail fiber domain-containing protein [Aeromicrobium phragmitis]